MTSAFLHFFNLSITAGWMVLVVLLLRLCLKKAPRWITCVLWGLVALRLLVPFTIESPVSLIPTAETVVSGDADISSPVVNSGVASIDKPLNNWLQSPLPSSGANVNTDGMSDPQAGDANSIPQNPNTSAPQEESGLTVSRVERILQIAAPMWLVGIGLMLLYEVLSILRVRSRVLDAVLLRDNVWQCDRVTSPFIFGLFRPRIYIPYGLEEPVLEQVLSHERAHLHRRDHWIKPFAFTLLAVYWYNPLLWLGYILLCRDIEVACDERVVRGLDEDNRRQYATALLQCGVERRSIAACPLAFGEVSIKQRIKSVLSYRKPLLWVIIVSLVVCSVAAVCLLTVPREESPVVLSSKKIEPDQTYCFYGTDVDGLITEGGPEWLWAHAENPDDHKNETDIPLVLCDSKDAFDELITALDDPRQHGMHNWFELQKYDASYFEDKVVVWLFVPGYDLADYTSTVTLETTNKGLRYAVTLDYYSSNLFDPMPSRCQELMLFEVDREEITQAKSLTTRHEKAPVRLPEQEGLTMESVGSADLDGDGEAEDVRLYHSALDWSSGWNSGYETAYLVVCKKDGTPTLRECVLYYEHSQCYLVPQEDGSSLLLFVENDGFGEYDSEEFGVLSLKDGERTVVEYQCDGSVNTRNLDLGNTIAYVQSLSGWMENAQLLYECENGILYYGNQLGDTPQYRPLCWLDEYRNSSNDTVQEIFGNILAAHQTEEVTTVDADIDADGEKESVSVVRYGSDRNQFGILVRKADGIILAGYSVSTYLDMEDLDHNLYFYSLRDANGKEQMYMVEPYGNSSYSVNKVTLDGLKNIDMMSLSEWTEYMYKSNAKLLFHIQGVELYFPDDAESDYLSIDTTKYMVENYNESITAYNQFLRGLRVAHEYGELDTTFYVSDLYADERESVKGVQRYTLADVTGDGVPELITEGYTMSVFTYQSGRVLRLYESSAGMFPTLLSNGRLWEWRMGGGGNTYRYTRFFEIGTTRTVQFGSPDNPEDQYYVDDVWMNKADFDAKTSTYFANAQSPALLIWYDYATKQPTSQAMVQYLSLLQNLYAYQTLYDVNGDGEEELLIKVDNKLLVYTKGNNGAQLLVEQEFASGTSRFLSIGDADYPGLIYFCVGGGKSQYYYLTLDNVQNKEFVLTPLWTDNYGFYEEGEEGRITELSDDKRLIELSRQAYQNNRDLIFSLSGGSANMIALDSKYQQAVYAYSSDSQNHRDVGVLQSETQDIIAIEGKYYQTYVSGNVDMRYIWLSQYEADIGSASWDWVPIGTEDDYSLNNIGKIDDGQRGDGMVRITYTAAENATRQEMEQCRNILEQRLIAIGVSGYKTGLTEDDNILLEVPSSYYPGDLTKIADNWGSAGQLSICIDEDGGDPPLPPDGVVLDNRHIVAAEAVSVDGGFAVQLTFTDDGAEILSNTTKQLTPICGSLAVWMDWQIVSTAQVSQPLTDGECVITGFTSWEAAALFAAKINAGRLPVDYLSAGVDFSLV